MAFKMKFNQDELKGNEPVPAGTYDVAFVGFKPKLSAKGDSINLNGMLKVLNKPELGANKIIFCNLNTKIAGFIQDFVHMLGHPMENQNADEPNIPGNFDGDPAKFKEDDPTTWVYKGPLTGSTGKVELGLTTYQGEPSQEIIKFLCKVPKCAETYPKIRHSKDMRKKS